MAKRVEDDATKTNTIDPKRAAAIIRDIEDKLDAKLTHKMEYVESCKSFNEAIANAYEMGAAFIPKKVLKAKIKEREHLRKAGALVDELEEEQRESFEELTQALGGLADLPLGQAAMSMSGREADTGKRKGGRKAPSPSAEQGDDEPDLRSDAQKLAERDREDEAARVAAENAERLEGGISHLN